MASELVAKPADVHLDHVRYDFVRVPNVLDELRFRDRMARASREIREQIEFASSQLEELAVGERVTPTRSRSAVRKARASAAVGLEATV